MNAFEKLTLLQRKVGYKTGEISPIALFGLAGESGEVLNGVTMYSDWEDTYKKAFEIHERFIHAARSADGLKKQIRDHIGNGNNDNLSAIPRIDDEEMKKFDIEVADVLYYLNAIAINRGKTLEEYAEISYRKVSAKTQINIEGK